MENFFETSDMDSTEAHSLVGANEGRSEDWVDRYDEKVSPRGTQLEAFDANGASQELAHGSSAPAVDGNASVNELALVRSMARQRYLASQQQRTGQACTLDAAEFERKVQEGIKNGASGSNSTAKINREQESRSLELAHKLAEADAEVALEADAALAHSLADNSSLLKGAASAPSHFDKPAPDMSHFDIFIQPMTGDRVVLNITAKSTVSDIMAQLAEMIDAPVEHQKLLYLGKVLKDGSVRADALGLRSGSVVQLMLSWKAFAVQQPQHRVEPPVQADHDVRPPDEAYTENLLGGDDSGPTGWLESVAHDQAAEARAAASWQTPPASWGPSPRRNVPHYAPTPPMLAGVAQQLTEAGDAPSLFAAAAAQSNSAALLSHQANMAIEPSPSIARHWDHFFGARAGPVTGPAAGPAGRRHSQGTAAVAAPTSFMEWDRFFGAQADFASAQQNRHSTEGPHVGHWARLGGWSSAQQPGGSDAAVQAMLRAAFAELERDAPRIKQLNAGLNEDSALAEALHLSSLDSSARRTAIAPADPSATALVDEIMTEDSEALLNHALAELEHDASIPLLVA